ncbi:hypothetical protein GCM10010981_06290 [Dyella nitratireducens]|uniref:Transposase DDE domain-containing protein n=1 Tax=Dyella nitratireducens TaxID=1849580 RepID=A0ABQ1FL70_9GAMM|nr:hypothetical protein GCM10010981_06290 [Dyella nitratireducens]GLQ44309.1 hypothetical protein GCM10007902_41590 [Dyella nitratireducens]
MRKRIVDILDRIVHKLAAHHVLRVIASALTSCSRLPDIFDRILRKLTTCTG